MLVELAAARQRCRCCRAAVAEDCVVREVAVEGAAQVDGAPDGEAEEYDTQEAKEDAVS